MYLNVQILYISSSNRLYLNSKFEDLTMYSVQLMEDKRRIVGLLGANTAILAKSHGHSTPSAD